MAPPFGGNRRSSNDAASQNRSSHGQSVSGRNTLLGSQHQGSNASAPRSIQGSTPGSQYGGQTRSQYDGPGSSGSQGSRQGSRPGSVHGVPVVAQKSKLNVPKLLGVGPDAFLLERQYDAPTANMARPGFYTFGRDITMRINSHRVTSYPSKNVYQYDVIIGNGDEKRGLNQVVWHSQIMKNSIGAGWIYDGAKIAWTDRALGQKTFTIDLDKEKGRHPNPSKPNVIRVQIKQVKTLGLQGLMAYMNNKADFTVECLEAINFMDHLMREIPASPHSSMYSIKRSFFDKRMEDYHNLLGGVVAVRGFYQSLRPAMGGLVVNADVANQCFWLETTVMTACLELAAPVTEHLVIKNMKSPGPGQETKMFRSVQRLRKVRFTVEYPNMPEKLKNKVFVIERILRTNARDTTFRQENKDTGEITEVSIMEYFKRQYNARVDHPSLPIVQACGKLLPKYPMEWCYILRGQRYPFKLSEIQTAGMIKFAVTRPPERERAINRGRGMIKWGEDKALKHYGLQISDQMLQTKAKLLAPPKVEFDKGKAETPGTSGRWRLDGKQFIQPNPNQLEVWTVMIFNDWGLPRDKVSKSEVDHFLTEFQRAFKSHGGRLARQPALVEEGNVKSIPDSINGHWNKCKQITKGREAQLMVFIVTAKNSAHYNRLKRQCDNRFGCVSQVMQSAHVKRCQGQYISNVLLKVFAKLGGFGFRACPSNVKLGTVPSWFSVPTMIVGADVSHGPAGSTAASIASMTVSMDRIGCRYWAAVQTNGRREEMVTAWNIHDMLMPAFREWMSTVGAGQFPRHLIYFRDGVSEGQYQHVLQREVRDMKSVWEKLDQTPDKRYSKTLKFTVVVASKRHHIRFFPTAGNGDKNGNAQPGTLVEKDVTHPREYDFYLCAHSAIQGTARPVHYHVLMDEAQMPVDKFVNLVYNHSYQYARSTTPVSIFPAIYYAHLAAKRAVAHDRNFGEEQGDFHHDTSDKRSLVELQEVRATCDRTGKIMTASAREKLAALERKETPVLLPLGPATSNVGGPNPDPRRFKWSMWYI